MERQFGIGLTVGLFVSGVACLMIDVSQQVGIGLIIVACIWGFLFVNPKSPVRKRWWSASNKLGITQADNLGVIHQSINNEIIQIRVGLVAVQSIQVDKIRLKIGRVKLWASDWKPTVIKAIEAPYISFPISQQLENRCYDAKLYAYTPNGISQSEKFSIDFN